MNSSLGVHSSEVESRLGSVVSTVTFPTTLATPTTTVLTQQQIWQQLRGNNQRIHELRDALEAATSTEKERLRRQQ